MKIFLFIFLYKFMTMTTISRLIVLLMLPLGILAQTTSKKEVMTNEIDTSRHRSFEIGFGIGGMNYQGDIIPDKFSMKNAALGYSIFGRYNFSEAFALRLGYVGGNTGDDDANYPSRGNRGYAFTGKVNEIHLVAEWAPTAKSMYTYTNNGVYEFRKQLVPYVFAGVATGSSSASTQINKKATSDETGANSSYLAVPFGIGFRYPISEKTKIGIEVGMRYTNSDYLDGFSKRANPNNRDTYTFGLIKASFVLGNRSSNK
jgi:OmpA-OmpF porin, OOP family